jgi:hypothetical protein
LYFIPQGEAVSGQVDSLYESNHIYGSLVFPTGQGMQGVNVIARRWAQYTNASQQEGWYSVSSVSGFLYRRVHGNPVTGTDPPRWEAWGRHLAIMRGTTN